MIFDYPFTHNTKLLHIMLIYCIIDMFSENLVLIAHFRSDNLKLHAADNHYFTWF